MRTSRCGRAVTVPPRQAAFALARDVDSVMPTRCARANAAVQGTARLCAGIKLGTSNKRVQRRPRSEFRIKQEMPLAAPLTRGR